MTDEEVEAIIWSEIERKGITYGDMTSLANHGVDPHQGEGEKERTQRLRPNLFSVEFGDARLKELLCEGEFNELDAYPPLKITFHDLFRFWWSRCVEKELVVDEVLRNIFEYFKEKMGPPKEERPEMDLTVNFGEVSAFGIETAVLAN